MMVSERDRKTHSPQRTTRLSTALDPVNSAASKRLTWLSPQEREHERSTDRRNPGARNGTYIPSVIFRGAATPRRHTRAFAAISPGEEGRGAGRALSRSRESLNAYGERRETTTGGKGAERRRKGDARIVDSRCKGYEGSVLLRRFLSRPRCRAGFPRGTFTVDRRRRRTCAIGRENVLLRKYRACRQVDRLSRGCYEREYLHPRVENALCNRRKTRSGFFFFFPDTLSLSVELEILDSGLNSGLDNFWLVHLVRHVQDRI